MRVLVVDPAYSLDDVHGIIGGLSEVALASAPWTGDDVVGLLTGPDFPVGETELSRLPALKVVATCSVGYDHLDVGAAAGRGVWVCNVPDYCVEEMADSSLALLLALMRGTVALDRSVRAGGWDHTVREVSEVAQEHDQAPSWRQLTQRGRQFGVPVGLDELRVD
jgi:D-3-phosphoglycerate dehydrogenase